MSVMTVTGTIAFEDMGLTLTHEHLFLDLRNQFTEFKDPEKQRLSQGKVEMSNLGRLRRNPYAVRDNLLLDEFEITVEEVLSFKEHGGATIIDCTNIGIHRDPQKLLELSKATGVQIVAGSGYYTEDTHPALMDQWSAEDIANQIVRDLTEGIDDTSIKAGVIGEIGTSDPMHPNERKSLLAAALAFEKVRVPLYVHTFPWGKVGLEATDLLLKHGVAPSKIIICHTDVEPDLTYIKSLLERGVMIEFDNFGKEFYIDPADRGFAGGNFIQDVERVHLLKQLAEQGYEKQLLATNDICLKMMLHAYGGWGYDHILRNIVPMMQQEGLDQAVIDQIICENPKRLFS